MEWKKLTKDVFPEYIVREENIERDTTIDEIKTTYITYRGKDTYIILIDGNHEPEGIGTHCIEIGDCDNRHIIFVCHAEYTCYVNTETGQVTEEQKGFAYEDLHDYSFIDINDKNLEYCKYIVIKSEDLADKNSDN